MHKSTHPTLTTLEDSKLSSTRHEHSVKDQNKLWKSREMTKNEAKFGSGRGGGEEGALQDAKQLKEGLNVAAEAPPEPPRRVQKSSQSSPHSLHKTISLRDSLRRLAKAANTAEVHLLNTSLRGQEYAFRLRHL